MEISGSMVDSNVSMVELINRIWIVRTIKQV